MCMYMYVACNYIFNITSVFGVNCSVFIHTYIHDNVYMYIFVHSQSYVNKSATIREKGETAELYQLLTIRS